MHHCWFSCSFSRILAEELLLKGWIFFQSSFCLSESTESTKAKNSKTVNQKSSNLNKKIHDIIILEENLELETGKWIILHFTNVLEDLNESICLANFPSLRSFIVQRLHDYKNLTQVNGPSMIHRFRLLSKQSNQVILVTWNRFKTLLKTGVKSCQK